MTKFQLFYTQLKNSFNEYFSKHRAVKYFVLCVFCLLCTVPAALLALSGLMSFGDNLFEDYLYQHKYVQDSPIVVISVDTIDPEYDILNDVGRTASLIDLLNSPESRPAVIGLNVLMDFDSYGDEYKHFLSAVDSGNVVLGKSMSVSNFKEIALGGVMDEKLNMRDNAVYPNFVKSSCREGYNNIYADRDGIVRHYLYDNEKCTNSDMESFAMECYLEYCEYLDEDPASPQTNDSGLSIIRFSKSAGSYAKYSLTDILMGRYDPSDFLGKIVIIGYYDSYLEQEYFTAPDHSRFVGNSEIQANAIYNLINGNSLTEMPIHLQLLIMVFVEAAAIFILLTCKYYFCIIACVAALVGDVLASAYFWNYSCTAYHPLYIIVSVLFVLLVGLIITLQRARLSQVEVSDILNRYMDSNVRKHILQTHLSGGADLGVKRNVAVMYANIRHFTAISEDMKAEDIVNMLNAYFSVADQCIHDFGGVLDKFVGDGVMAFWDDAESNGDAAFKACQAALAIEKGILEVDDAQFKKHGREVSFGIGIAYGEAVLGDIGSKTRRSFTAIGGAANLAAELESVAPKGTVFISENVYQQIEGRVDAQKLPMTIRMKDRLDNLNVYVLNALSLDSESEKKVVHLKNSHEEKYTMTIFGCRGSYHVSGKRFVEFGGQTTCSVIKIGTHAVIIDCGTGLYDARWYLADCTKIDVLLSHVHYDHCLGLLDWSIFPKDAELNFYGNFKGWLGLRTFNELFAAPFWPVDPVSGKHHQIPDWGKSIYLGDDISVRFFPSPHPNGAAIMHIKAGEKNICVMVDCERSDGLPFELVEGCDLLMYDGMYNDMEYESRQGWGHSTWQEGCRLAARAKVSQLIITHHNPMNTDAMLLATEGFARNIFPDTVFARAGMVIKF